jgi:hypothetical protein
MDITENDIDYLEERKIEIKKTLENLKEIMEKRNHLLICFEKNVYNRVSNHMFSRLNTVSKGTQISRLFLMKKNYELDLKLIRRAMFYFEKRKRALEAELKEITLKLMMPI